MSLEIENVEDLGTNRKLWDLPVAVSLPRVMETIWIVAGKNDAACLGSEGIRAGRIWRVKELVGVQRDGCDLADLVAISLLRIVFDASLASGNDGDTYSASDPPKAPGGCYSCDGSEFWESIHGATACLRCHAPADRRLAARTFLVDAPSNRFDSLGLSRLTEEQCDQRWWRINCRRRRKGSRVISGRVS